MLWTDAGSRDFIAEKYPWFLDTFDGYKYNIQRADVIRYFVLHHYGGIYIDLDIGCLRPIDPLLAYPVILPKTIPVGVSNDLIFSARGHPFMEQTIHNLNTFDHSWVLNYPTVMFSTGPMFLSAQYGIYTSSHPTTAMTDIRILPKSLYGKNAKEGEAPNSFFSHFYGSSWHADDAAFIGFLGTWGKGLMWLGLIILILGLIKIPKGQRRYNLRRYEVLLPRISNRSGRWHLVLGSSSTSITPPSSSRSSSDNSPIDGDVPVLHLPLNVRSSSPAPSDVSTVAEPYVGRASSPIADAYQRIRTRVINLTSSREGTPRSPARSRRSRSRGGILFFLPAIFTPSQDIELEPACSSESSTPRARADPFTSEKRGLMQDLEPGLQPPSDHRVRYESQGDSANSPGRSTSRNSSSRLHHPIFD